MQLQRPCSSRGSLSSGRGRASIRCALRTASTAPRLLAALSAASQNRAIVVAVDDDQMSWEAVRFTVQEVYREGDVLHLLHVISRDACQLPIPHASLASMHVSATESMDFETALQEHAMTFIRQTMVGLADARKARCEVDIVRGACRESIGQAICKAADQLQASLIVVPGYKSSGFLDKLFAGERVMFGSYVAKHAKRPCLVFSPQPQQPQQQQQQQQPQQPQPQQV